MRLLPQNGCVQLWQWTHSLWQWISSFLVNKHIFLSYPSGAFNTTMNAFNEQNSHSLQFAFVNGNPSTAHNFNSEQIAWSTVKHPPRLCTLCTLCSHLARSPQLVQCMWACASCAINHTHTPSIANYSFPCYSTQHSTAFVVLPQNCPKNNESSVHMFFSSHNKHYFPGAAKNFSQHTALSTAQHHSGDVGSQLTAAGMSSSAQTYTIGVHSPQ